MPARIFISYAREDEKVAYALADHLDQLRSLGIADTWIDRDIGLGESWEAAIAEQAEQADVILLLVSHAYLAGGFAHDKELGLLEEAGKRGARVIPVIVGECAWQAHRYIGSLQAFAHVGGNERAGVDDSREDGRDDRGGDDRGHRRPASSDRLDVAATS